MNHLRNMYFNTFRSEDKAVRIFKKDIFLKANRGAVAKCMTENATIIPILLSGIEAKCGV